MSTAKEKLDDIARIDSIEASVTTAKNEAIQSNYGFKNYIINGGFDVWQRGEDITYSNGYTADRVYVSNVNNAYTTYVNCRFIKEQDGVLLVKSIGSDTGTIQIAFPLELPKTMIGKTVTLSFAVSKDSGAIFGNNNANVRAVYRVDSGNIRDSGNFIVVDNVGALSISHSTALNNKYSFTFTVPSFTNYLTVGAVINSIQNTQIDQSLFRFSEFQLEEGSVATPFEQRPYGLELSLCQRYYHRVSYTGEIKDYFAVGRIQATNQVNHSYSYPVKMRVAPTTSQSGVLMAHDGTTNTAVTVQANNGLTHSRLYVGGLGGTAVNGATALYLNDSSSYIDFDAEL